MNQLKHLLALSLCLLTATAFCAEKSPSLYTTAVSVMQKHNDKERIFLVDVRTATDFEKFKIPGSVNIPLSFIKTKAFLKTAPVVLIQEGYRHSELENEARSLRDKGFNISILEGGLWAWKQKGGTIVGNPFVQRELNRLPASVFFQEKEDGKWLVMDACGERLPEAKGLVPKAVHVPVGKKEDMAKLLKGTPSQPVLIFNERGENYELIEAEIPAAFRERVFFLEGGLEDYRKFVKFHLLAAKPKEERVKRTGACAACEEEKKEKTKK